VVYGHRETDLYTNGVRTVRSRPKNPSAVGSFGRCPKVKPLRLEVKDPTRSGAVRWRETRGGERVPVGTLVHREIGVSEFLRTRNSGHHKSRKPGEIGTVRQIRDAWQPSTPSGKVPIRKPSIDVWSIGISGIPWTWGLCTLESRNVKPDEWGTTVSTSELRTVP
jgi:hypothetical protein